MKAASIGGNYLFLRRMGRDPPKIEFKDKSDGVFKKNADKIREYFFKKVPSKNLIEIVNFIEKEGMPVSIAKKFSGECRLYLPPEMCNAIDDYKGSKTYKKAFKYYNRNKRGRVSFYV